VQQLAREVGANVSGPARIFLRHCSIEPKLEISFTIAQLLNNQRLKALTLCGSFHNNGDFQTVKAAFESNQSLEDLCIEDAIIIRDVNQLKLLFNGIAAAPNLRTLELKINDQASSSQKRRTIIADALIECHNSSLEYVKYVVSSDSDACDEGVAPILQFNSERRIFQGRAHGESRQGYEQLVEALAAANSMDNHHLHFWLVRNHAGEFRGVRGRTLRTKRPRL
jgi:hypothetical protein